jgi:hypothetical protein
LNTKIEVESVDFEFVKTFVFNGVYIEDQGQDTLLYLEQFKFDISNYNLTNNHFQISELQALSGVMNINKNSESDSVYNFQFIIDALITGDQEQKTNYKINCDKIILDHLRLAYFIPNNDHSQGMLNIKDICVDEFSAKLLNTLVSPKLITTKLKFLQLRDKSGFEIQDMFGYFSMDENGYLFEEFELTLNRSEIDGDLRITKPKGTSFQDASYDLVLNDQSSIQYSDIGFFRKEFQNINYRFNISGALVGTTEAMTLDQFTFDFGNNSHIYISGFANNLLDAKRLNYDFNIQNTVTSYADLKKLPIPYLKDSLFLPLPSYLEELGIIQLNGVSQGSIDDLSGNIELFTALGNIKGDLNLHSEDSMRIFSGGINIVDAQIPKGLTGKNSIQRINGQFDILGDISKEISIQSTGFLNQIMINEHKLNSLVSTFQFDNKELEILLEDSANHKNFRIESKIAFRNKISAEGSIIANQFDINQLGLSKENLNYKLTTSANFKFKNVKDYLEHTALDIDFIELIHKEKVFNSQEISVSSIRNESKGLLLSVSSDIIDLDIEGELAIDKLPIAIEIIKHNLAPEYYDSTIYATCEQNFNFKIESKKINSLLNFLEKDIELIEPILINGALNNECRNFIVDAEIPQVSFTKGQLNNIEIEFGVNDSSFLNVEIGNFHLSDSISIKDIALDIYKPNNEINYKFSWNNHTKPFTKGIISGILAIETNQKLVNTFNPSRFTVRDSIWDIIENNRIEYYNDTVNINSLVARHNDQIIGIDGIITKNPKDKLDVVFKDFEMENFNPFLASYSTQITGLLDGNLSIYQPTQKIIIDSKINIDNLSVNDYDIGKGRISTNWNTNNSKLELEANFLGSYQNSIDLKGSYYPEKKNNNLDVGLELNRFELATIEDLLKGTVSKLKGKLTGQVKVDGSLDKPNINGEMGFSETEFVVDYLNTKYKLGRDRVKIKDGNAYVKDMKVIDAYGAIATANGSITHESFKKIKYNITLTNKDPFQYLNTNDRINPAYNGQAFLDKTKINIFGSDKEINIDVKARTAKHTEFNIPLSNPEEVTESGFITFVSDDQTRDKSDYHQKIQNIKMNFDLEITDDAKMKIVFDEKVGDVIKTTGRGNMNLEINSLGKFNLYGEYVIVKGDYLFTLKNIINKKFDIVEGSKITWNGNPYAALLDIKTSYRIKAPLSDIMNSVDSSTSYSRKIPVNCYLNLSNELTNPTIDFDIELPSAENEVLDAFNGLISKEGEITRQFFSLLVLNRFIAPNSQNAISRNVGTTNTSEMLSHQISNWLSKISNDFDLGVKYSPGDEISDEQVELILSTQLFNDRLSIEGNFGVGGENTAAQETNNLVGDVLVEYKVKKDGSVSLKAYNSSNDYNIVDASTSQYTQGVGVLFRKDFNSFQELFRSIFKFGRKPDDPNSN